MFVKKIMSVRKRIIPLRAVLSGRLEDAVDTVDACMDSRHGRDSVRFAECGRVFFLPG